MPDSRSSAPSGPNTLLAICIPTYNRSVELKNVLEKFLPQVVPHDFAIYVSDNGSEYDVEGMIRSVSKGYPHVYFRRNASNVGFDRNAAAVINLATSEYIWVFSDDDEPVPGAVNRVCELIRAHHDVGLFILNSLAASKDLTKIITPNVTGLATDKPYERPNEVLLGKQSWYLTFATAFLFKKEIWNRADATLYYGTTFVVAGAVLDGMSTTIAKTMLVADPLITYRTGNAFWGNKFFEVVVKGWGEMLARLPDSYSIQCRRSAMEQLLRGSTEWTSMVAARVNGGLDFRISRSVIFPYYMASNKFSFVNVRLLVFSVILCALPASLIKTSRFVFRRAKYRLLTKWRTSAAK